MVDDAHIDVLIDIAKQFERAQPAPRSAFRWFVSDGKWFALSERSETEIGRMLLAENARSVGHRYTEGQNPAALMYTYRPTRRTFTAGEALNAIGARAKRTPSPTPCIGSLCSARFRERDRGVGPILTWGA